jgi:hypothetical protein
LGKIRDGGQVCAINSGIFFVDRMTRNLEWAKTHAELDAFASSIDRLEGLRQSLNAVVTGVSHPGVEGYDALNVGAVKDALEGLSLYEIHKVGLYEAEHKNRVTVLRRVEAKLNPNI